MKGFNKARKRLLLLYKRSIKLTKDWFLEEGGGRQQQGEEEGGRRGGVISIFLFTILF